MVKRHHYYIECTFEETGKNWQRWSQETYSCFFTIKADVCKLCEQQLDYNKQQDFNSTRVPKVKGFRVVHETIEVQTETVTEYLFD